MSRFRHLMGFAILATLPAACSSADREKQEAVEELRAHCRISDRLHEAPTMSKSNDKLIFLGILSGASSQAYGGCIRHFTSKAGYVFNYGLNETVLPN